MKLLMLITSTETGGAPKHLLDLMSQLSQEKGIELFLASPDSAPFYEPLKKLAKKNLVIKKNTFRPLDFCRLKNFIADNQIELIHSHGRGAGMYARLLHLFGIKVVHTFHGIHANQDLMGRIKRGIDQVLRLRANHYIFVSEDEKVRAEALGVYHPTQASTVIRNGVKLSEFPFQPKALSQKTHLILGTFSRPDYAKGMDRMLEELKVLKRTKTPFSWEFHLAGRSLDSSLVPVELQDKIVLVGEVTAPAKFFNSIDVFVSFSRWEGMPLAVLEAMSSGVQCVLSEVPGHFYFLEKKLAKGISYQEHKLAHALDEVMRDQNLPDRARAYMEREHDLDQMANKTLTLYRKLT